MTAHQRAAVVPPVPARHLIPGCQTVDRTSALSDRSESSTASTERKLGVSERDAEVPRACHSAAFPTVVPTGYKASRACTDICQLWRSTRAASSNARPHVQADAG